MVRLFAALALAVPVAACAVVEGKQDVGEYADDSVITNNIRARFIDDKVVHFGDIGVTTLNGNVRLSGRVNSRMEAARAVQIARGVKGVRSVSSEILVR
jgi:osmotically-inducible protein OsmY